MAKTTKKNSKKLVKKPVKKTVAKKAVTKKPAAKKSSVKKPISKNLAVKKPEVQPATQTVELTREEKIVKPAAENIATRSHWKHTNVLLLLLIIVTALVVRIYKLSLHDLSPDEAFSLGMSSGSFKDAWDLNLQTDSHPPLRILLTNLLFSISNNFMFMRYTISTIPSLIFIGLVFLWGRKIFSETTAIIMAFIAALGFGQVQMGEQIRNYMLMLCFITAGMIYLENLRNRNDRASFIGYLIFMFLASQTNYMANILIIGIMGARYYELVREKRVKGNNQISAWLFGNSFIVALSALYLYVQYPYKEAYYGYGPDAFSQNTLIIIKNFFQISSYFTTGKTLLAADILIFALFVGGVIVLASRKKFFWLVLAGLVFAINIVTDTLKYAPFTPYRHSSYLIIIYLLFIGAAVEFCLAKLDKKFARKNIRYGLTAGLVLLIIGAAAYIIINRNHYRLANEYMAPKAKRTELMTQLKSLYREGDVVIMDGVYGNYLIYEIGLSKTEKLPLWGFRKFNYEGMEIYSNRDGGMWPTIYRKEQLSYILSLIPQQPEGVYGAKIWYLKFSPLWGSYMMQAGDRKGEFGYLAPYIEDVTNNETGMFYSIKIDSLKDLM